MIWNGVGIDHSDIAVGPLAEICRIGCLAVFVPFRGIDAFAADILECESDSSDAGKQVYKPKVMFIG